MRRNFKLLLATVAILAVMCSGAWAGEKKLSELTGEDRYKWQDGNTYVADQSMSILERIIVNGTVTLILTDGSTLSADHGINVGEGNELTITTPDAPNGTGRLMATSVIDAYGYHGAAIGGGVQESGGKITILGGTVTAVTLSAVGAAAIGGGELREPNGGETPCSGGDITILGGTVTASASMGAAGIGGSERGAGGTITINGGTVVASAPNGSGIGGGYGATDEGTLSSGPCGSAWIYASSVGAKTNVSGKEFNSGVLFDGNNGKVYGIAKVVGDVAISADQTLEVLSGAILDATKGTLDNKGTITNDGVIELPAGMVASDLGTTGGTGFVYTNTYMYGNWYKNDGSYVTTRYDIKITSDSKEGIAKARYAAAPDGVTVTLSATPNTGYAFERWDAVNPIDLQIANERFTMPNEAVEVKATFKPAPTPPPAPTPSYTPGKYTGAIDTSKTADLWNARENQGLTIHIGVDFDQFTEVVSLDDEPLVIDTTVSHDFGAREGSTVVTIWERTLKEHIKADGEHTAEVGFKDGTAIHTFTVRGTGEAGETKHSSGGACTAGAAALVAIAALAAIKRRSR